MITMLRELEKQLEAEISEKRNQLAGVQMAIKVASDAAKHDQFYSPRNNASQVVLDIIERSMPGGMSARETAELVDKRGYDLRSTTVATTLSQLKREGLLVRRGSRYHLKRKTNAKTSKTTSASTAN